MMLQCNVVSHWLSPYTERSLIWNGLLGMGYICNVWVSQSRWPLMYKSRNGRLYDLFGLCKQNTPIVENIYPLEIGIIFVIQFKSVHNSTCCKKYTHFGVLFFYRISGRGISGRHQYDSQHCRYSQLVWKWRTSRDNWKGEIINYLLVFHVFIMLICERSIFHDVDISEHIIVAY